MIISRPLVIGFVFLALSSITNGRATVRSAQAESGSELVSGSTKCSPGKVCIDNVPDIYGRAPPRLRGGSGAGGDGNDGPHGGDSQGGGSQTGSGAQTGGGSQTGGNEQTGGSAQNGKGNDDPAQQPADPNSGNSGDTFVEPKDPYSDLDANFAQPGRAPGVDVLPNEIPNHRGLEPGTPQRASYQKFVNWDIQGSRKVDQGSHWLFYRGNSARNERVTFKNEFNAGQHRDGLLDGDTGRLVDNTDIYNGIDQSRIAVPAGQAPNIWLSELESYGVGKRAAQQGGIARVLADGKQVNGQWVIDKDKLLQEGSFFYNFEAEPLTNSDSKLDSILVYNADAPGNPPEVIWSKGNPPLGKQPDWIDGTTSIENRPTFGSDDGLIDLGD